jgi:hypothetical protein
MLFDKQQQILVAKKQIVHYNIYNLKNILTELSPGIVLKLPLKVSF